MLEYIKHISKPHRATVMKLGHPYKKTTEFAET